jgi:hypothetical protein
MLTLTILGDELFDQETEEFSTEVYAVLELEHSLDSLSKWESIFEKPFLGEDEKTTEEALKYIELMILTPNFPPEVLSKLSQDNLNEIDKYINRKMSATWFNELPTSNRGGEKAITSEVIYYWMTSFNIPFECQYWHLNRLFTLIKIFNIKNGPSKNMSTSEVMARNRELNAQRRQQLGTKG